MRKFFIAFGEPVGWPSQTVVESSLTLKGEEQVHALHERLHLFIPREAIDSVAISHDAASQRTAKLLGFADVYLEPLLTLDPADINNALESDPTFPDVAPLFAVMQGAELCVKPPEQLVSIASPITIAGLRSAYHFLRGYPVNKPILPVTHASIHQFDLPVL